MITTSWQEAGFPDIRNVDYGVPMFVIANAALEYNYIRIYQYREENRDNYLQMNCQKRLSPDIYNGLWDYLTRIKYDIIGSLWSTHYLFSHGAGSFDISQVSKEGVIRDWTATPSGQLIIGNNSTFTPYFLAEAARQAYMILSGYVYFNVSLSIQWSADYATVDFDSSFPGSVAWFNSMFNNPDYYVGFRFGNETNYTGKTASGSRASFPRMADAVFAKGFGIVRGTPRNSYWVGKRISN